MKCLKFPLLILSFLLLNNEKNLAQTIITDNIYSSTTWQASGSPYIIANNIVVFGGAVLTIEPGVTVKFKDNVTIDMRGQFVAKGTATNRVVFTSDDSVPVAGSYGGIKVSGYNTSNPQPLTLSFCNISYAKNFVDLGSCPYGIFNIRNCSFYQNYNAIGNTPGSGSVNVDSCRFEGNQMGLNDNYNSDVYVTRSAFINNATGTTAHNVSNSVFAGNTILGVFAYTSLTNCEIYGNNVGAEWDGHASTTMQNNYIHDNAIGIKLDRFWNEAGIVLKNNKICSNTAWNIEYHSAQNADLSNNCFCLTNNADIRAKIRDGYVDASFGLVTFNIDNACNAGVTEIKTTVVKSQNARVYPNPFYEQTTFEFDYFSGSIYKITIADQLGRTIRVVDKINNGSVVIEKGNMVPGIYYYRLTQDLQIVSSGKLVVE